MIDNLHKLTEKLIEPLTLEEAYRRIILIGKNLFSANSGSVFWAQHGELVRVYSSSKMLRNISPRKKGYTYQVFRKRKPIFLSSEELHEVHPELLKKGINSVVILPLFYHRKSLGVITFQIKGSYKVPPTMLTILHVFSAIATLTIENASQYSKLERALKMRDTFIRMAAHELKTPLTTIEGYAFLLKRKYSNETNLQSILTTLHEESKRMIQLVEELLEINRIESGRITYDFEVVLLDKLFMHVVNAFEGAYLKKPLIARFQFDKRSKPKIIGDWNKLTQVCMNILNNAVKYSEKDTPIYFSVSKKYEEYILEFTDQGFGIDTEDLPKIFEGFYTGKDAPSGSMGVGLYLAREIVTAHRGVIDVDSVLGKGTSVFVRLPRYTL